MNLIRIMPVEEKKAMHTTPSTEGVFYSVLIFPISFLTAYSISQNDAPVNNVNRNIVLKQA